MAKKVVDLERVRRGRALADETQTKHPGQFPGGFTDAQGTVAISEALDDNAPKKKQRGSPLLAVRLPPSMIGALDEYRLAYGRKHRLTLSRSEAIRRLISLALESEAQS